MRALTPIQKAYLQAIERAGGRDRWVSVDQITRWVKGDRALSTTYTELRRLRSKLNKIQHQDELRAIRWIGFRLFRREF
jgi:hypothetical protein